MTRWQRLAETNPTASPEQKALMGLMVVAELENSVPSDDARREPAVGASAGPKPDRAR